jgi:hypothetical protein
VRSIFRVCALSGARRTQIWHALGQDELMNRFQVAQQGEAIHLGSVCQWATAAYRAEAKA